ncbi:MAG: nitroreductase family deazaflavin-dependent oxidoreductase [Acidimicrobiia bacterium]
MPLPGSLARFNKRVTNRITLPFAARLPFFAVIEHKGRRSGKSYRTPVNCWVEGQEAMVALTYGTDTDWLKNLQASGGGSLVIKGERLLCGPPTIDGDDIGVRLPAAVRVMLSLLDVDRYAVLPLLSRDRPT